MMTLDEIGMTDDEWRRHHGIAPGRPVEPTISALAERGDAIAATVRVLRRRSCID